MKKRFSFKKAAISVIAATSVVLSAVSPVGMVSAAAAAPGVLSYTVTYDLNGGTGSVPTQADTAAYDSFAAAAVTGLTPPPIAASAAFKEWNTKADGYGLSYQPGAAVQMPAQNLTLYAIWIDTTLIPKNLQNPPEARTDTMCTLLWDKPAAYRFSANSTDTYNVYQNGVKITPTPVSTMGLNVKNLSPGTTYTFTVRTVTKNPTGESADSNAVQVTTKPASQLIDVTQAPYNANTQATPKLAAAAIQNAIADAAALYTGPGANGGTVYIPAGVTIVSAPVVMVSHMSMRIDGTLKGSTDLADYPVVNGTFEGWPVHSYESVLTAGKLLLDPPPSPNPDNVIGTITDYTNQVTDIAIFGSGTVDGSGIADGTFTGLDTIQGNANLNGSMTNGGLRSRGHALNIYNGSYVYLQGVTFQYGPSWTTHFSFTDHLTYDAVSITAKNSSTRVRNGDGIDPESSTNINVFNVYIHSGDDAIAIKSGKNLNGVQRGKPTTNMRITDVLNDGSNGGICIGSEMSGGIEHVLVQNYTEINTLSWEGLDIKTNVVRGGYVRDVVYKDCFINKVNQSLVRISLVYSTNNDGVAAPTPPAISDIHYENVNATGTGGSGSNGAPGALYIAGLASSPVTNVTFKDCNLKGSAGTTAPANTQASIDYAKNVVLDHVTANSTNAAQWNVSNSSGVVGLLNPSAVLAHPPSYTALNTAIAQANALTAGNFKYPADWAVFQTALTAALTSFNSLTDNQAAVTTATNNLIAAMEKSGAADKTALQNAIDAASALTAQNFMNSADYDAFAAALANANAVNASPDANQADIDAAASALIAAMGKSFTLDFTALDALIAQADGLNATNFHANGDYELFYNALTSARNAANTCIYQADVDALAQALSDALAKAVSASDFVLGKRTLSDNETTPGAKIQFVDNTNKYIAFRKGAAVADVAAELNAALTLADLFPSLTDPSLAMNASFAVADSLGSPKTSGDIAIGDKIRATSGGLTKTYIAGFALKSANGMVTGSPALNGFESSAALNLSSDYENSPGNAKNIGYGQVAAGTGNWIGYLMDATNSAYPYGSYPNGAYSLGFVTKMPTGTTSVTRPTINVSYGTDNPPTPVLASVNLATNPAGYGPAGTPVGGLWVNADIGPATPAGFTGTVSTTKLVYLNAGRINYVQSAVNRVRFQATTTVGGYPIESLVLFPVPPVYTVTFDSGAGTPVPAQTVTQGDPAALPADPARPGYVFMGWRLGGADYDFSAPVTSDITLTAAWSRLTHTVTFDYNDGVSAPDTVTVYDGDAVTQPADPARAGYSFDSWDYEGVPYDFSAPVTADITLTAQWDQIFHTVAFDSAGGSAVAPLSVAYGAAAVQPANPSKAGYIFTGWFLNGSAYNWSAPVTADITLTAQWTENTTPVNYAIGASIKSSSNSSYTNPNTGVAAASNLLLIDGNLNGYITGVNSQWQAHSSQQPNGLNNPNGTNYKLWAAVDLLQARTITNVNVIFGSTSNRLLNLHVAYSNDDNSYNPLTNINTVTPGTTTADPFTNPGGWTDVWSTNSVVGNGAAFNIPLTAPITARYWMMYGDVLYAASGAAIYTQEFQLMGPAVAPVMYNLTYDSNYGVTSSAQRAGGSAFTAASADTFAAPDGMAFKEWNTAKDGTGTSYAANASVTMPNSDLALYAIWQAIPASFTVTFDAAGGAPTPAPQSVTAGGMAVKPANPTKAGYTFDGWFASGSATAFDFGTAVTSDLTLTAHWTLIPPVTYTVTFDAAGGSPTPTAQTVTSGGTATKPANPAKAGYTFDGWFISGASTAFDFGAAITADLTLTAHWTSIPVTTYTVTFDAAGGSPTPTAQTVTSGGMATKPANPTKAGYTFDGWFASGASTAFDFGTAINADLTLTAHWTLIPVTTYTVTFDAAGGSPIPPAQTVASGGKATPPVAPTKADYTFAGWYLGGALYNFNAPVTANITLVAQWTSISPVTYTVTFNANGGSPAPAPQTVTSGGMAAQPAAPTMSGYTFDGWFLGGTLYNFSAQVTANITLVAQWTPVSGPLPPTSITMSAAQTSLNMKVGAKLQLQITVNPVGADPSVTWSSSNPAVASVDPVTGLVTAIKTGSVRITVKSNADPTVSYMFLVMINA